MDLVGPKALRIFVVLAEELHFGRAALRLGHSQSTISEQLRHLEDDLGVVLFDRHSRGVSLSDAGRVLLEPAQRLLDDHERLMQLARTAAQARGTTTLGVLAGAMPLIARLAEAAAAADISLAIRTVTYTDGIRAVATGELSALLGVLLDAVPVPTLTSMTLARSQVVAVMAPSHRLARSPRLAHDHLVGERVLVASGYIAAVERQIGAPPRGPELEEIPSVPHATGDLLAGSAVALSLQWFSRRWSEIGLIDRELDPPIDAAMGLVHRSTLSGEAMERVERLARLIEPLLAAV